MPIVTVDNTKVEVPVGTTVLDACRQAGAKVPTLCYLEGVQAIGACRICLVEVEGARTLVASCSQPAADGMVVKTNTSRVRKARRTVLELLLSEHDGDCQTCVRSSDCELRTLALEMGIDEIRYEGEKTRKIVDTSTPGLRRDTGKCIMCRRCVTVCNEIQGVGSIFAKAAGFATLIGRPSPATDDVVCVQCGMLRGLRGGSQHENSMIDEVGRPSRTVQARDRADRAAIQGRRWDGVRLRARYGVSGKMGGGPLRPLGFRRGVRHNLRGDLTIWKEGTELLTASRRRSSTARGALPLVHQLLPRLDQLHGALRTPHDRQPVHLLVAPADVRRHRLDLLRRVAGPQA